MSPTLKKILIVAIVVLVALGAVDGYFALRTYQYRYITTLPQARFTTVASSSPIVVTRTLDSNGMYLYTGTLPATSGCAAGIEQRTQYVGSKPPHLTFAFTAKPSSAPCTTPINTPSSFTVTVGASAGVAPVLDQILLDGGKVDFTLVEKK